MTTDINIDLGSILDKVRERLRESGIDFDLPESLDLACGQGSRIKVVCVTPDLKESVEEMGRSTREHVVMVRVDDATLRDLDAWVATGAVKSRSEAAALFIREGLKVRSGELERLREALAELEEAKQRLEERAREVFGSR